MDCNSIILLFALLSGIYPVQNAVFHAVPYYNNATKTRKSIDSYRDLDVWGKVSPTCYNGHNQSPIALDIASSVLMPSRPFRFENYFWPLKSPVTLRNTGRTVEFHIVNATGHGMPAISGNRLTKKYIAASVHFHWGAPGSVGSEHVINGESYDVEVHIVHRNSHYLTMEQALKKKDGLAIVAIMLQITDDINQAYDGFNEIFDVLPKITNYNDEVQIHEQISLGKMFGDITTKPFYTYTGSLTIPPCTENVSWIVFSKPILIARNQIKKFFNLTDMMGNKLLNNYRSLQLQNNRTVYVNAPGG